MLILKHTSERITLKTDGKVDVYACWRDTPTEDSEEPGGFNTSLQDLGGAADITVIDFPEEGVKQRMVAMLNISCQDQKDVRVGVFITNGSTEVMLFSAEIGPEQPVRYMPQGGFVTGEKPSAPPG